MFGEKMFCEKYSKKFQKTKDEILGKHNFNKVAGTFGS